MRNREFYCASCGLFYWMDKASSKEGCPNNECISKKENNINRTYSVSSMAFAYYYKNRADEIRGIAWSSRLYAPESAIEHYKKQGMTIKF